MHVLRKRGHLPISEVPSYTFEDAEGVIEREEVDNVDVVLED
jgi:hypothetical protein